MQLQNKKLLIIVSILLLFFIFIIIFIIQNKDSSNGVLIDEPSGEEVSTLQQENEVYGTVDDPVLILGLSPLLESGITMERLEYIKEQFNNFSTRDNIDKISIYKESIETERGDEVRRHFNIRVDEKKKIYRSYLRKLAVTNSQ